MVRCRWLLLLTALTTSAALSGCGRARPIDGSPVDRCVRCHASPPATGAHARHATRAPALVAYGDLRIFEDVDPASTATDYSFGCGSCHPLDSASHMDGTVQVELSDPAAPPLSIKALSPVDARFDPATKRCGNVYCHSSGQPAAVRKYAETPAWDAGPGSLDCFGCHGNPPTYANGGAGSETANSHVPNGNSGHFGSAYRHGNYHALPPPQPGYAVQRGAAVTCQVCHYESVDPANTGPSGFYYLDTTMSVGPLFTPCTPCHSGSSGEPAVRTGKAWPLRHVNGKPSVVFDPRQTLPAAVSIYDGKPWQPSRPYWSYWEGWAYSNLGPDVVVDQGPGTASFHVANAFYDPVTRTCSNVACHKLQPEPPWSWGQSWVYPDAPCAGCHV